MSAEAFLDSDVLVYLFDSTAPAKRQRAESLIAECLAVSSACISHQVVQETLNVMIRKLNASQQQVGHFLSNVLMPLWKINPTQAQYVAALSIRARFQFSFYDSLVVAAALEANCATRFSEDLQHGQRIDQLTLINPFA